MESTSDSFWAGADVSHDTAVVVASKKSKSRKTPRYAQALEYDTRLPSLPSVLPERLYSSTNFPNLSRKPANSDDHHWLRSYRFRTKSKPKRNSNTQPWLACTQEEAKPYKKYKKLYGERKFARDFVSTRSPSQTLNSIFLKGLGTNLCHS